MMRLRTKRYWTWLVMLLGGASLFQVAGGFTTQNGAISSCSRFWTNGIATSVDFCYLLDCRNGFFGGLVQPCGGPYSVADDLLVDCSWFVDSANNTNTGTGTGTSGTSGTTP